jgi:hypothetical protein
MHFLSSKSLILFYNISGAGKKVWVMAIAPFPLYSDALNAVERGATVQI